MCIIEHYLTEAQTPEYPGDLTLKKKKNPNTLLQREKSYLIQGENWDLEIDLFSFCKFYDLNG